MFDSQSLAMGCGLLSALVWGSADFTAGFATKKDRVLNVLVLSQAAGLLMLVVLALLFAEPFPELGDILLGALAGLFGASGCTMLYRALAHGRMGVVAPVSAISTAVLPVFVSMFLDGMPAAHRLCGIGLALVAVWFLSGGGLRLRKQKNKHADVATDLRLAFAAGLGFAGFFVCIDQASDTAYLWPLISARTTSVAVFTCIARMRRELRLPGLRFGALIALAGVLDAGGNIFFALATGLGRLDIAAVLSSLYPGATVFWAYCLLHERLRPGQWAGVAAALTALLLIAW